MLAQFDPGPVAAAIIGILAFVCIAGVAFVVLKLLTHSLRYGIDILLKRHGPKDRNDFLRMEGRLFTSNSKPPDSYSTQVTARFNETWQLNGHVRTADQVLAFSDEVVSTTPDLTVHWYQFEFDSVLYEFNLVGEQTKGINTQDDLIVRINPGDLTKCWMNGHELVVHPWEPPDDL